MVLTKKHRAEIQTYVDDLRTHVALLDWKIIVEAEFGDEDVAAQIRCIYGTRHAFLSVGVSFDDHSLKQQRHVIVHELLHCHLNRVKGSVINVLNQMGREVYEVGKAQLVDEAEYAVDSIADALAPKCPMPPWTEDG